jgi:hypothetical protein
VVAEFRERLEVSKQTKHRYHMDRFNLKKLNEDECKENYRFGIPVRLATFAKLRR